MKKIILTGFEPFGPYQFNPTKELVEWNDARTVTGNEHIIGVVLPCTYYGAFKILSKLMEEEKPDAVISVGLSSSVKAIRIETIFRNKMKSKYTDANGYHPNGIRINSKRNSRKMVMPTANTNSLAEVLSRKNIPVEMSDNADTFICNSLAYLTTQKILDENLQIRNIFIHVPWTDDYSTKIVLDPGKVFLKKETLHDAIDALVEHI